jgi:hypothetical protein
MKHFILEKAEVKGHWKTTETGKRVWVHGYQKVYDKDLGDGSTWHYEKIQRPYTKKERAAIRPDSRAHRFLNALSSGDWVSKVELDSKKLVPWGQQGYYQMKEWKEKGFFESKQEGGRTFYKIAEKGKNALKELGGGEGRRIQMED